MNHGLLVMMAVGVATRATGKTDQMPKTTAWDLASEKALLIVRRKLKHGCVSNAKWKRKPKI